MVRMLGCILVLLSLSQSLCGQDQPIPDGDKPQLSEDEKFEVWRERDSYTEPGRWCWLKSPAYLVINEDMPISEVKKILLENPDKHVISFSEKSKEYVEYHLRDLQWEKAKKEWNKKGRLKYIVPSINGYKDKGGVGQLFKHGASLHAYDKKISQEYVSHEGNQLIVDIHIYSEMNHENPQILHELLQPLVKFSCTTKEYVGSVVVESEDKNELDPSYAVLWRSGTITIQVYAKYFPKEVVEAYLRRYPSDLPKDMKFDRMAWGKRELALRLKEMREKVEAPDDFLVKNPPSSFGTALVKLRYTFVIKWTLKDYSRSIKKKPFIKYVVGKGDYEGDCKEWTFDWDGYRKARIEFNKKILADFEEWAKNVDTGLTWNKEECGFEIKETKKEQTTKPNSSIGKTNNSNPVVPKWLTLVLAVVLVAGVVALLLRSRRAKRLTSSPEQGEVDSTNPS